MTLLVHAIIRADDRPSVGTEHPTARVVAESDVAAVVSEVAREIDEQDAAAHLELLSALATAIPALPLVFATVAADEQAVRDEVLRPGAGALRHQLEALADVVEVRVGVRFDEEAFWALIDPASDVAQRLTVFERDDELWAALLLQRDRLPDMDAAVATMRAAGGDEAEIEYVGPLPPLAFLPELLEESQTSRDVPSPWGW